MVNYCLILSTNSSLSLSDVLFDRYKGENTKATFRNMVSDLENLGQDLSYFLQDAYYNPGEKECIFA